MGMIILASGSPRRKELLEQIGLNFEICPAKGEEVITKSIPSDVVLELSKQKAEEVAGGIVSYLKTGVPLPVKDDMGRQDLLVIGADTVVAYGDNILGKPKDESEAKGMLAMLSGKTHSVYTGVTCVLIGADGRTGEFCFFEKTDVTLYPMSEEEIQNYIATGEPMDKAGSYAIQGIFAKFINKIDGDYYNVVGLPIPRLYQELNKLGIWETFA
jgi:septum formation protein